MNEEIWPLFFLSLISCILLRVLYRRFSFTLDLEPWKIPCKIWFPLGGFFLYFLVSALAGHLLQINLEGMDPGSPVILPITYATFFSSLVLGLFLGLYFFKIKPHAWKKPSTRSPLQEGFFALIICLLFFPIMGLLNELFNLLTIWIFHLTEMPEQLAVIFLKMSLEHPFSFFLLAINVIFFAPWIEEILFRGILQTWLRTHLSTYKAVALSAALFAFFHYTQGQGPANLPILLSLFFLGLLLGFLYEKRATLLASMIFHGCFNFLSVINLYVQSPFDPAQTTTSYEITQEHR